MADTSLGAGRRHLSVSAHLVLAFTLAMAVVGVFPHQMLFVVPLAAAVTLSGLHPMARGLAIGLSTAALLLGLLLELAG